MIEDVIVEATKIFAKDVLDTKVFLEEDKIIENTECVSKIEINGEHNYQIYVAISKKSLKKMAHIFLLEEEPTKPIIQDLLKEISNIIIGRAKVILQEKYNINSTISTPEFINNYKFNDEKVVSFTFEGDVFSIFIK